MMTGEPLSSALTPSVCFLRQNWKSFLLLFQVNTEYETLTWTAISHSPNSSFYRDSVVCPKSHHKLVKQEGLEARCLALKSLYLPTGHSLSKVSTPGCVRISTVCASEPYILPPSQSNICFQTGLAKDTNINVDMPHFMQSLFLITGSEVFPQTIFNYGWK